MKEKPEKRGGSSAEGEMQSFARRRINPERRRMEMLAKEKNRAREEEKEEYYINRSHSYALELMPPEISQKPLYSDM